LKKYWFNNSPIWTHFANAWSILFPAWESAFVKVAQYHLENVTDPELKARVNKFIEQELAHARAHIQHNRRADLCEYADKQFEKTRIVHRRPESPFWLATMVSIEHIAACKSRAFLTQFGHCKGREFNLFAWHSREELEHKSLAMDLWNHLGYSKKQLNTVARKNVGYVWKFALSYTLENLKKDGQLWRLRTLVDSFSLFNYVVIHCWIPYLQIFKQDFHPSQFDDSKFIEAHA
jgi:predicted metal-dependent hydrolase